MSQRIILTTYLLISILFKCVIPEPTLAPKRNITPFFSRRMAEEIDDNTTLKPRTMQDDSQSHLVSVFVKNVRQLFDEFSMPTSIPDNYTIPILPSTEATTVKEEFKPSGITKDFSSLVRRSSGITKELTTEVNVSVETTKTTTEDNVTFEVVDTTKTTVAEINVTDDVPDIAKDVILLGKTEDPESDNNDIGQYEPPTSASTLAAIEVINKSCIFCNNIELEDCTDPTNKLVPSIACQHEDDVCYTMHTPFGIVDRGCFNVKYNLTEYVCSCNLCNYIPVTELPHRFSHKKEWVENVIEQSNTINFKKSVFKDMTCVACEVNATSISPNVQDNNNCYEGNVRLSHKIHFSYLGGSTISCCYSAPSARGQK
ncbi:uncharacterized protein isoform X2 [Choristoneura fumiferana]|uniref:uncharacterized protein isoform X2 n=1 Tax=Choristoneura fumiferana TaxID=7141 RepID=UPI003D15D4F9